MGQEPEDEQVAKTNTGSVQAEGKQAPCLTLALLSNA